MDADRIAVERTPFDVMREREVARLVDDALASVPALYREALVLFYFEQQSTKAVASALGVTEDVVHQRLSRGRRHLAATFERHVEASLGRRRSRRDLAAVVLAALAVLPRSVHAHPRGVTVMKLSAVTVAAATAALTTITLWPAADAAPRQRATPKPVAASAAPAPGSSSPALPSSSANAACTQVVRHIVDVSFDALEGPAKRIPKGCSASPTSSTSAAARKPGLRPRPGASWLPSIRAISRSACRPRPRSPSKVRPRPSMTTSTSAARASARTWPTS